MGIQQMAWVSPTLGFHFRFKPPVSKRFPAVSPYRPPDRCAPGAVLEFVSMLPTRTEAGRCRRFSADGLGSSSPVLGSQNGGPPFSCYLKRNERKTKLLSA